MVLPKAFMQDSFMVRLFWVTVAHRRVKLLSVNNDIAIYYVNFHGEHRYYKFSHCGNKRLDSALSGGR